MLFLTRRLLSVTGGIVRGRARIAAFCHTDADSAATTVSVSEALDDASNVGRRLRVRGWVKAARKQKMRTFADVDDGGGRHLQVVADAGRVPAADSVRFHSCVSATGTLEKSGHPKQDVELIADAVEVLSACEETVPSSGEPYPFGPRKRYPHGHSRQFPMFRAKMGDFAALLRARSALAAGVRDYFRLRRFVEIQTPVLTENDCEAGGDVFEVSAPLLEGQEEDDYFGKKVFLTVSGQLHLEAVCNGLGKVYNFSPCFRAERSRSKRHLSEFTMVEAEEAFVTTTEEMTRSAEDLIKHALRHALETAAEDFSTCRSFNSHGKKEEAGLEKVLESRFVVMPYKEAFEVVSRADANFKVKPEYGSLGTEHERYLAEEHCDGVPVFVVDWPAEGKPFYVTVEDGLARAMDLLLPRVGEVCGGSLREHRYPELEARMASAGVLKGMEWYLDLRRAGAAPTAGFGLGYDRLVQFALSVNNIKDALPFPRSLHKCQM